MKKVLVLAVHPDDETLGCGATLFKHKSNNDEIHWLIATELIGMQKGSKKIEANNKSIINKRKNEIDKVSNLYGFSSVNYLNIPTTKVDKYSISDLVSKISTVINKVKPQIVYLPFKGDIHSDHQHIFNAALSCTKTFRYPFIEKIYMMETLSETEFSLSVKDESFIPNTFNDVTNFIDLKVQAMKLYEGEYGTHPFPRSIKNIEALATYRGATAGFEYAESFMLVKEVIK